MNGNRVDSNVTNHELVSGKGNSRLFNCEKFVIAFTIVVYLNLIQMTIDGEHLNFI